ncbi:MAG: hypothetical protein ABI366_04340 [Ginsengibacter sp.]
MKKPSEKASKKAPVQNTAATHHHALQKAKSEKGPPNPEEIKKALQAKKELAIEKALAKRYPGVTDLAIIKTLVLDEKKESDAIILSDHWYEASVLTEKLHLSKNTLNSWMNNGWLAYHLIGRIRLINKADFENMMKVFRRPSIFSLAYIIIAFSEWNISDLFII